MTEPSVPLTALFEAQRAQAFERFTIIRSALEEGISEAQVARASKRAPSTIRLLCLCTGSRACDPREDLWLYQ